MTRPHFLYIYNLKSGATDASSRRLLKNRYHTVPKDMARVPKLTSMERKGIKDSTARMAATTVAPT